MTDTFVKSIMEKEIEMISPDASLQEACIKMKDIGCGILPVGDEDRVEGMITDRDIVIRAIASGVDTALAIVRDYMTPESHSCTPECTIQEAAELMNKHSVSRLLVRDKDDNVTGILTFGHVLRNTKDETAVEDAVHCATGRKDAA
jgi:CBS domain-containing protein